MKKFLAAMLAATMMITACPTHVVMATRRGLSQKIAGITAKANVDNGYYEVDYSWKAVKGAKYQYRYKLADSSFYGKIEETTKAKAAVDLGSYSDVTFQVRAYKTVNGVKHYSVWTSKRIRETALDKMFEKARGMENGYIKGGITYQYGLKAEDPTNPDCDLTIAVFSNGMVQTGEIAYIVYKNGKIDSYGMFETEIKTLPNSEEGYVEIKVPEQGEDRPAYTVGYYVSADFSKNLVVTEDGKFVVAKEISLEKAWELQQETGYDMPGEDSTEKLAKKELVKKAKALAKKEEKGLPILYGLRDVDRDGFEELFYVRAYNRMQIEIYRYDDKKAKAVLVKKTNGKKSLDGVSCIYAHNGEIVVEASNSAYDGEIVAYRINESGKLQTVTKYKYNYLTKKYSKDGKTIKKATLEKYRNEVSKYSVIDISKRIKHD
jgi:hypothetical protein